MRLSRIDVIESMRLDRINVPAAAQTDATAIEAFAASLAGSGKPMLISGAAGYVSAVTQAQRQPADETTGLVRGGDSFEE
jgi:hypothetical protein